MVGNDIIDIAATKRSKDPKGLGWKRHGFVEKIFTKSEQKLIADSKDAFITVWQLWSMKESAYKIFIQAGGTPFYNPKRIECELDGLNGKVVFENLILQTKNTITENYIFTVAEIKNHETISEVVNIGNDLKFQSKNLREQLFRDFSKKNDLDSKKLKIEKIENGVPRLFYDGKDLELAISLTHCGEFGGYSFKKVI